MWSEDLAIFGLVLCIHEFLIYGIFTSDELLFTQVLCTTPREN